MNERRRKLMEAIGASVALTAIRDPFESLARVIDIEGRPERIPRIPWMPETVSRWSITFKRASRIHGLPEELLDKIALDVSVSVWTYTDYVLRMWEESALPESPAFNEWMEERGKYLVQKAQRLYDSRVYNAIYWLVQQIGFDYRPFGLDFARMSDNLVLQAYKTNGMKGEFMLLGEKDETLPGDLVEIYDNRVLSDVAMVVYPPKEFLRVGKRSIVEIASFNPENWFYDDGLEGKEPVFFRPL